MIKTEADLAKYVVQYLEEAGWTTYKEVCFSEGVIDIVAIKGHVIWGIETKLSFTTDVLEQALTRLPFCHYVSVAVKRNESWKDIGIVKRHFCKEFGIGVLTLRTYDRYRGHIEDAVETAAWVDELVKPKLNRNKTHRANPKYIARLRENLFEDQKTSVAGSRAGGHITHYQRTVRMVREYLTEHGPKTMREIVAAVKHHYSSDAAARSTLVKSLTTWETGFVCTRSARPALWDIDRGNNAEIIPEPHIEKT